jgi:uncharacterized MAPEG superfamily protein
MTIPLWCVSIATFLPFLWAIVGAVCRYRQFGTIDNNHPRLQQAQLSGIGARAMGAQQNAWEALAMFAPAVLVAHVNGARVGHAATAALLFIAARVVHGSLYLADLGALRSLAWAIGAGAVVWLFVLAARGG